MKPEQLLAIAATAVILSAIAGGMILIEGPSTARAGRFDQERLNNLNIIAQWIGDYYRVNGTLPNDLSVFADEYQFERASVDPRTGELLEYGILESDHYRLCAVFETEGPHHFTHAARVWTMQPDAVWSVGAETVEGKGRQCFEVEILTDAK